MIVAILHTYLLTNSSYIDKIIIMVDFAIFIFIALIVIPVCFLILLLGGGEEPLYRDFKALEDNLRKINARTSNIESELADLRNKTRSIVDGNNISLQKQNSSTGLSDVSIQLLNNPIDNKK